MNIVTRKTALAREMTIFGNTYCYRSDEHARQYYSPRVNLLFWTARVVVYVLWIPVALFSLATVTAVLGIWVFFKWAEFTGDLHQLHDIYRYGRGYSPRKRRKAARAKARIAKRDAENALVARLAAEGPRTDLRAHHKLRSDIQDWLPESGSKNLSAHPSRPRSGY